MVRKLIWVISAIIVIGIMVLALFIFNNFSNMGDNSNVRNENNITRENSGASFRELYSKQIDEKMANRLYWEVIDDIKNCERIARDKDATESTKSYGQPETQNVCSDYEGKPLTFVDVQIAFENGLYLIVETKFGINFTLPLKGNLPSSMQTSKKWTISGVVGKDSSGHIFNVKNAN